MIEHIKVLEQESRRTRTVYKLSKYKAINVYRSFKKRFYKNKLRKSESTIRFQTISNLKERKGIRSRNCRKFYRGNINFRCSSYR